MTREAAATVGDILTRAAGRLRAVGVPDARVDAEWLLADLLQTGRSGLWIARRRALPDALARRYDERLRRRLQREPLQHILGRQEFHGLTLEIDRRALIPRPETETLVDVCLELELPQAARVLDLGTGSGCIAVALAVARSGWRLWGIDRSSAALELARANAARHHVEGRIALAQGDFARARDRPGRVDLVVSNPPYVREADWAGLEPEVRDHDPREALVAGPTGLEAYEVLARRAPELLRPGGWLVLELGAGQSGAVRALLRAAGLDVGEAVSDLRGIARVLPARSPAAPPVH